MDEETTAKVEAILGGVKEPVRVEQYDGGEWDNWAQTIEVRLSRHGQILVGLGVGVGVTLMLGVMQGKVVINLVKGHKMVVDAINTLVGGVPAAGNSTPSYAKPEKVVDESKGSPVDEEELRVLRENMLKSNTDAPDFGTEA